MPNLKSLRRLSLSGLALAAIALAAQAASAQDTVRSLKVSYGDLNVHTAAGAELLYQRIRGAAHFVCGARGRSLLEQQQWRSCVRGAISEAVTRVHSPLLSALDAGAGAVQVKTTQRR